MYDSYYKKSFSLLTNGNSLSVGNFRGSPHLMKYYAQITNILNHE
jgi:hypothetical protein